MNGNGKNLDEQVGAMPSVVAAMPSAVAPSPASSEREKNSAVGVPLQPTTIARVEEKGLSTQGQFENFVFGGQNDMCYFEECQNDGQLVYNCSCPPGQCETGTENGVAENKVGGTGVHCQQLGQFVHCDHKHDTFVEDGVTFKKCTHVNNTKDAKSIKKGNRLAVQKYRRKKKTEFENLKNENAYLKERVASLESELKMRIESENIFLKEEKSELLYLRNFTKTLTSLMSEVSEYTALTRLGKHHTSFTATLEK
jgi:hypothetical protein